MMRSGGVAGWMLLVATAVCAAALGCGDAEPEDGGAEGRSELALESYPDLEPENEPGDGSGRYRKRRGASAGGGPDAAELEQLSAIGYLDGTKAAHAAEGVTRYDATRSAGGVNLVVSAHAPEAILMDMEGRTLHRWVRPSAEIWPGKKQKRTGARYFRRAYLMEQGDLLVIFEGLGLAKLDRDSNVLWTAPPGGAGDPVAHHDLEVQRDGDILALTRFSRVVEWINPKEPILDDYITLYGPDGQEKQRISLADAFGRSPFRKVLLRNRRKKGDIFHTNSIHRLDGSVAHVNTAFDAGNVLLSIRHLDMLAVLDPKKEEIVWARRGPYGLQHDAEVLPNGSVLLFDNGTMKEQSSRAIELDPKTLEVRWEYAGSEQDPLWSRTCGIVQRLPGGNTLVVESDNGRALEVTPEGEIVWEWLSPPPRR